MTSSKQVIMKKLTLLISTILFIQLIAISQPCLPEGYTFLTQADIDNFQTYYPNCTEIEGDVEINGEDITNLTGLNILNSIGGDLNIGGPYWGGTNSSLTSLSGLENLNSIGGSLAIIYNNSLVNLTGLDNLTSILGNLVIGSSYYGGGGNPSLTSLTGLENLDSIGGFLYVQNNGELINLTGLNNVSFIGGYITIHQNLLLSSLEGLDSLNSIEGGIQIGGDMYNSGNPSLTSLAGLDNLISCGSLSLGNNDSLSSLSGLNNLTSIGGDLWIADNDALTSLTGLESLNSIEGNLHIGSNNSWLSGNHSLTSLSGLSNLVSIDGALFVCDNIVLTSLSGLDNIEAGTINFINISNNASLVNCDVHSFCNYLAAPNTFLTIYDNAPGCNSPEEVIAACDSIQTSILEFSDENIFTVSPNPLESSTKIEYTLHQNSQVTLQILDLNGKSILNLVDKFQRSGEKEILFNGNRLKPGIYFCVLKTNEGINTSKIIKL